MEKARLDSSNADILARVDKLRQDQSTNQADVGHQSLLQQLRRLEVDVKSLATEREGLKIAAAGGIEGMQEEIARKKQETSTYTDNIYSLESHLKSLTDGDKAALDAIRQECYGGLYVEGDGLAELDGI